MNQAHVAAKQEAVEGPFIYTFDRAQGDPEDPTQLTSAAASMVRTCVVVFVEGFSLLKLRHCV